MDDGQRLAALRAALPAGGLITAPDELRGYVRDWRGLYEHPALAVALPRSTEEVAAVVRACAAAGLAIVPQGGNTGLVGGGVPAPGRPQVVLSCKRMRRILAVDPAGDTITVEAGCTVAEVAAAAADAGRLFPLSFAAEGSAQVGGVVSTNAGGMQVLRYGSTRALVLGLRVVLADGQVWDGMRALRKDNTGFDLKQLFIGGEGTLGIVTEAVLKLFPAVPHRAAALAGVADAAAAMALAQVLRRRAGEALNLCEYISGPAMALGAAHTGAGTPPFVAGAYVLVELTGQDEAVAQALEAVLARALDDGTVTDAAIAQSEADRLGYLALREAVPEGELREGGAVKHDLSVPLAALVATVGQIEALVAGRFGDCRLNVFGHLGDGNLHVNVRPPPGGTLADLADRKAAITAAVEAIALSHGGSFSAEHGIGQLRVLDMLAHKPALDLALMRRIKAALDPQNLFNPGKVIPA